MLDSKLCCFRYYIWTWVVITLFELRCMLNYLWTCCNMWHICWIMYDLGCMLAMIRDPSWYSTDYRVYMSSSVCGSMCMRGQPCLILYKLVGSLTRGNIIDDPWSPWSLQWYMVGLGEMLQRGERKRAMCNKGGYRHDMACGIEPSSPWGWRWSSLSTMLAALVTPCVQWRFSHEGRAIEWHYSLFKWSSCSGSYDKVECVMVEGLEGLELVGASGA
jgi:hypothetical protein